MDKEMAVYKYEITTDDGDIVTVTMPHGAEPKFFAAQNDNMFVWAVVDKKAQPAKHKFRIAGTGHELTYSESRNYIGTAMLRGGALVFHLFDLGEM